MTNAGGLARTIRAGEGRTRERPLSVVGLYDPHVSYSVPVRLFVAHKLSPSGRFLALILHEDFPNKDTSHEPEIRNAETGTVECFRSFGALAKQYLFFSTPARPPPIRSGPRLAPVKIIA